MFECSCAELTKQLTVDYKNYHTDKLLEHFTYMMGKISFARSLELITLQEYFDLIDELRKVM